MKRKVIQIANSTQLISLPRKWALGHAIRKGDELEVTPRDNELIISLGKRATEIKKIEIDISGLGNRCMRYVGALYRAGYDELVLRSSSYAELKFVQIIVQEGCIGYELIEQGKQFVRIKKVSDAIDEEFNPVLKRLINYLITMSREIIPAVQMLDEDQLKYVTDMDRAINKFTDFCGRILVTSNRKGGFALYHLLIQIEQIGDQYKRICQHLIQTKIKVNPQIVKILEECSKIVSKMHELFFKFNKETICAAYKKKDEIDKLITAAFKVCTRDETLILAYLKNISDTVDDIDQPIIIKDSATNNLENF